MLGFFSANQGAIPLRDLWGYSGTDGIAHAVEAVSHADHGRSPTGLAGTVAPSPRRRITDALLDVWPPETGPDAHVAIVGSFLLVELALPLPILEPLLHLDLLLAQHPVHKDLWVLSRR
jgi:hypothetical protein